MPLIVNEKTGNKFEWPAGKPMKPGHRWADVAPRGGLMGGLVSAQAESPVVAPAPTVTEILNALVPPEPTPAEDLPIEDRLNAMKKTDLMAFCQHQWGKTPDVSMSKADMVTWALEQAVSVGVVF